MAKPVPNALNAALKQASAPVIVQPISHNESLKAMVATTGSALEPRKSAVVPPYHSGAASIGDSMEVSPSALAPAAMPVSTKRMAKKK